MTRYTLDLSAITSQRRGFRSELIGIVIACAPAPTYMDESFLGRRLRCERERRLITLESIAANTKISIGLLRDLERDDVSRWPSGIFRRSFVRSYAEAIGLDGDDIVREFLERFPDQQQIEAAAALVANGERPKSHPKTVLRLTLADTPQPFSGGPLLKNVGARIKAVGWDCLATLVARCGGIPRSSGPSGFRSRSSPSATTPAAS